MTRSGGRLLRRLLTLRTILPRLGTVRRTQFGFRHAGSRLLLRHTAIFLSDRFDRTSRTGNRAWCLGTGDQLRQNRTQYYKAARLTANTIMIRRAVQVEKGTFPPMLHRRIEFLGLKKGFPTAERGLSIELIKNETQSCGTRLGIPLV
jgi:hypothetical protein